MKVKQAFQIIDDENSTTEEYLKAMKYLLEKGEIKLTQKGCPICSWIC